MKILESVLTNQYRKFVATIVIFTLVPPSSFAQAPTETNLYYYRAVVTEVYDGDTITVDLDLGFHVWVRDETIRLANIDAPELRGDTKLEGKASRDFLRDLILGQEVIIQTIKARDGGDKKGKYGRYLGVVWLDGRNVNELLVQKGFAATREF